MNLVRLLAALALLSPLPAMARSTGILDAAPGGCGGNGCHGTSATPTTRVCIQGLPSDGKYTPNTAYTLNVFVDGIGIPPMGVVLGGAVAGFNILGSGPGGTDAASAGAFGKAPGDTAVRFPFVSESSNSNQLTHAFSGRTRNHWNVTWTSPSSGTVTLYLAGNAVNGNGVNDGNDLWNRTSMTLVPSAGGSGAGPGIVCNPPIPLPQLLAVPSEISPAAPLPAH